MRILGLRISLAHISPILRLAVKRIPVAVVDITRRVHPNESRPTTRSSRPRRSSLRRSRPLPRLNLTPWHRRHAARRRRSRHRLHRCLHRRNRQRGQSGVIPGLHPLMPSTSPRPLRRRRISPVLADPVRPHRSCRRCLGPREDAQTHNPQPNQQSLRTRHDAPWNHPCC